MGWEPRRAGRRDQARDTPADPGSGRRAPSREARRDRQRGFAWPGEEPGRPQSAEDWLSAFGEPQGERPAVTRSAAPRSPSRHPGAGQPPGAGPAVPQRSSRPAAGYPAERYGRVEASRPEAGNGRAGAPGERLARQPTMREPGEPDRGLAQRRGPGSPPRPNPRTAPAPDQRALRGPEPGRAPNPGRHARADPDPRLVRRPDERAPRDAPDAARSAHPAAAGVRARESRMPPVNTPGAPARPPAPGESGRAERPIPHPARRTPVTPATGPDDETIPLPVILEKRPAAQTAGDDRDAPTPVRPARLPAEGPRYAGNGTRPLPAPMQAKLDQLKALYRTAEAIGEEALTRHFDRLSQRQGDLIREYFEQARLRRTGARGISDADSYSRASPRSASLLPPH